ncbi:hypothetical protein CDCA_CDCA06G1976 [Cyanidium caldarium]|uniref:Sugar phosphate transporter domain-containing protein n=1 Tax=Cyanidium caldarium TaxID=2771 RepID=A0AAV9IV34_CYACA|nr:hypothetical protein CDCA_CDCA06G1976 [Cyanidium caldarium]
MPATEVNGEASGPVAGAEHVFRGACDRPIDLAGAAGFHDHETLPTSPGNVHLRRSPRKSKLPLWQGAGRGGWHQLGDGSPAHSRSRAARLFALWNGCSILHLYVTRELLARYRVSEVFLTLTQMLLTVVYGLALMRATTGSQATRAAFRRNVLWKMVPLAALATVRDVTKFAGLARISVNLSVTLRSLSPVATVGMQWLFWGDRFSPAVLLSLLPIMAGVTMASIAELAKTDGELAQARTTNAHLALLSFIAGCAACCLSVLFGVAHAMAIKTLFTRQQDKIDPVHLQVLQSLLSIGLLTPYYAGQCLWRPVALRWSRMALAEARLPPAAGEHGSGAGWHSLQLTPGKQRVENDATAAPVSVRRRQIALFLVAKGLMNFAQSHYALLSLNELSNVAFSIASSMRRMLSGLLTVLLFYRDAISVLGVVGICVSVLGCMLYDRACHTQETRWRTSHPASAAKEHTAAQRQHGAAVPREEAFAAELHEGHHVMCRNRSDFFIEPLVAEACAASASM